MKLNIKLLLIITSFVGLFGIVVVPLYFLRASDTSTVTATITVQNISVSISDGNVNYGTIGLDSSAGTNGTDTQTATNNGNILSDFNIKGQNSAAWTLSASNGANQYVHRFCTATCTTPPTNYTALTANYQTLATSIAANGTQTFDLYITTPSSTSSYTQQSVDVLVQAIAH